MTSSNVIQRRSQDSNVAARNLTGSLAFRIIVTALFVVVAFAITGCSGSFDPKLSGGATTSGSSATFTGKLHGGQQPVAGAEVFVFQVGESGYPGQSGVANNVSIISSNTVGSFNGVLDGNNLGPAVLTDSNGNFSFTLNNCTTGDGVYIATLGGQAITGQTNAAESSMAPIGICPATGVTGLLQNTPFVNVNEVSTVAFAYAMGGFTAAGYDFSHISTSATNIAAMQNAFMLSQQLFSVSTAGGANSGSASMVGATFPAAKINTMANVLSDCVNSGGVTGSSSPCYTLFQNATSNGTAGSGVVPTDTASAMINITHNVVSNVSVIYGLASNSYAPFSPTLTAQPADFSAQVVYNIAAMGNPYSVAIDSAGYVYVLGQPASASSTGEVAKISPSTGLIGSVTLPGLSVAAIDQSNNVFFANVTSLATTNANAISEYGPSTTAVLGTQASGSPFTFANVTTGTLDIQSHSLSIGPTNDLLLVEENNHAFRVAFTSGSYSSSALALFAGNINAANSIAENGVGNILLANSGFNPPNISAFSNTTGNLTNYIQTANADAQFMALSYNGSAYTIGQQDGLVTYANFGNYSTFANTTSYLAYALAGANAPIQPEVDGLSNVWAPNVASGACTVSKYLFGTGNIYPSGLAINNCSNEGLALGEVGIDPSGNLWVSVLQNGSAFSGYVTEVLGVAAPTITPLSLQTLKEVPTNTSMDIRP